MHPPAAGGMPVQQLDPRSPRRCCAGTGGRRLEPRCHAGWVQRRLVVCGACMPSDRPLPGIAGPRAAKDAKGDGCSPHRRAAESRRARPGGFGATMRRSSPRSHAPAREHRGAAPRAVHRAGIARMAEPGRGHVPRDRRRREQRACLPIGPGLGRRAQAAQARARRARGVMAWTRGSSQASLRA